MENYSPKTEIYIPDGSDVKVALNRTTHLSIVAHHDDIEIATLHGVLECFKESNKHFFGVVVTDGKGSARGGRYKNYTDDEIGEVRKLEQKKAAMIGEYSGIALLNRSSKEVKDPNEYSIVEEIKKIILDTQPEIIYTHNLADKHDTHLGVVTKVIKAIRLLPKDNRPKKLLGCEVWRDLDWLNDDEKVILDVGKSPNLGKSLIEVHDSQIDGSKAYDLAIIGKRLANATFSQSHSVDAYTQTTIAMDLTPLVLDDELDVVQFTLDAIKRFEDDVRNRLTKTLK
jgi:LmbE family N-acetylglucosaminyl deacetylase